MTQVQSEQAFNHLKKKKKKESITFSIDQENVVSKIFIRSLRLIRRAGKEMDHAVEDGPQN